MGYGLSVTGFTVYIGKTCALSALSHFLRGDGLNSLGGGESERRLFLHGYIQRWGLIGIISGRSNRGSHVAELGIVGGPVKGNTFL